MTNCKVSLSLPQTEATIQNAVVNRSVTGEKVDIYRLHPGQGNVVVMVFEKHYYRAGNRLTLTVTLDDLEGVTRVHMVGAGGGDGLFRFDWGAAGSFEAVVADALLPYRI